MNKRMCRRCPHEVTVFVTANGQFAIGKALAEVLSRMGHEVLREEVCMTMEDFTRYVVRHRES